VDTALAYATSVEETGRQDYPYTGLPVSASVRQKSGASLGETSYAWSMLNLGSGAAQRRFPYPSSVTQRRYGEGGIHDGSKRDGSLHDRCDRR
jgi:hypothetical protein